MSYFKKCQAVPYVRFRYAALALTQLWKGHRMENTGYDCTSFCLQMLLRSV